MHEHLKQVPSGTPGVYCLYDLDDEPAYAGQSGNVHSRLRQHFIRQDSSVVSYGRLDVWDIRSLEWWATEHRDRAENLLLSQYNPYLNLQSEGTIPSGDPVIDLEDPDGRIELISEQERQFRAQPYNRTKQKLDHLRRMLDKIELAGHSDDTKRTMYEHQRIFEENLARFLGVENPQRETDLDAWTTE